MCDAIENNNCVNVVRKICDNRDGSPIVNVCIFNTKTVFSVRLNPELTTLPVKTMAYANFHLLSSATTPRTRQQRAHSRLFAKSGYCMASAAGLRERPTRGRMHRQRCTSSASSGAYGA